MDNIARFVSRGADYDGVTAISIHALKKIKDDGAELIGVRILGETTLDIQCHFFFADQTSYSASGFAIGYGGEGPHGLHETIRMFCPDDVNSDFWRCPINSLDPRLNYEWDSKDGFHVIVPD